MNWPMECRSVEKRCSLREQALVVLALALAEQLLIPLVHQGEVGLVALQDLNSLALAVQDVADGGILVSVVVRAQHGEALEGIGCALHQFVDTDPGGSDGQQAHSGENGVAAAHIVRNNKGRSPARQPAASGCPWHGQWWHRCACSASSTPISSSSSLRRTRNARLVSVVVPDLEMTLMENFLPLHRAMISFR